MAGYPVRQSMMNLSKNLYVFMLALLMVASGCLGSGSDEPLTPGEEEGEVEDGLPALMTWHGTFPTPGVVDGSIWFPTTPITNFYMGHLWSLNDERGEPWGAVELKRSDICVTSVQDGVNNNITRCVSNQLSVVSDCLGESESTQRNGWYDTTVATDEFFPGAGMACVHHIYLDNENLWIAPGMNITDGRFSILLAYHDLDESRVSLV